MDREISKQLVCSIFYQIEMMSNNEHNIIDDYKHFFEQYKKLYLIGIKGGEDEEKCLNLLTNLRDRIQIVRVDPSLDYNSSMSVMYGSDWHTSCIVIINREYKNSIIREIYSEYNQIHGRLKHAAICSGFVEKVLSCIDNNVEENTNYTEVGYTENRSSVLLTFRDKVIRLMDILDDEVSCYVFLRIMQKRLLNYSPTGLVDVFCREKMYFTSEIIKRMGEKEVFYDIGAYPGDAIEDFVDVSNGRYKYIYSFEIDQLNNDYIKHREDFLHLKNIVFLNMAVGDYTGGTEYVSSNDFHSRTVDVYKN